MMADRNTTIDGNQIKDRTVTKQELDATSETTGYVLTVQGDGSVDWEASSGGSGGGSTFKQTFVTGDLTADKITITHNLGTEHPVVGIYNGNDKLMLPTDVKYLTTNTIELDFTDMTPLSGTYKVRVIGSGGTVSDRIQDEDNDTKVEVEKNSDEDKIRFTSAGIQRAIIDSNGLALESGTNINEFSIDGTMAGNSDDAVSTEKAIRTYIANNASSPADTQKNEDNILINAFRIAVNGSLTQFNMIDGIVDEYEDESGIDNVSSLNETYNSTDDYYSPTPGGSIATSPFSHMKMENNTDDGSGANAVSNIGTPTYTSGKILNALTLDGSTDALNVDALVNDIKTDNTGSISFWEYSNHSAGNDAHFVVGDANANQVIIVRRASASQLYVTAGGARWETVPLANSGQWNHIVIVQNATLAKIYVNGVLDTATMDGANQGAWFNDLTGLDTGRIGCSNYNSTGNADFFDGQIDDFRYYQNIVLTQADIDKLYNSGTGSQDDKPSAPPEDMTLISESFTAEAVPDTGRIVILEEDVDSVTLNTDLLAYASRDGGSSWVQGTLSDEGDYDASRQILVADFDFTASGIGSGTAMEYKLVTANNKDLRLHASGLTWD